MCKYLIFDKYILWIWTELNQFVISLLKGLNFTVAESSNSATREVISRQIEVNEKKDWIDWEYGLYGILIEIWET
jgi:hypothetical protein